MLNWLKFLPIKFSFDNRVHEVKGPYFSKMHPLEFQMNGCTLSFEAPWRSISWQSRAGIVDNYRHIKDNQFYSEPPQGFSSQRMPNERWGANTFFLRSWDLNGPWLVGPQATLQMQMEYVGPNTTNGGNPDYKGTSFFHPNVFVTAIEDYLQSLHGHNRWGESKNRKAPVDWHPTSISPICESACFNIEHSGGSNSTHKVENHIAAPISDDRFVLIRFTYSRNVHSPYYPQLKALADKIIATIKLELSNEIITKLDNMRKSGVDMKLTRNFPPIKWNAKQESSSADNNIERLE